MLFVNVLNSFNLNKAVDFYRNQGQITHTYNCKRPNERVLRSDKKWYVLRSEVVLGQLLIKDENCD